MKNKKYHLILAILTAILCVPTLGEEIELHLPKAESLLIARANPALAGIEQLNVHIAYPGPEANKHGLVWGELQAKVRHKLKEAGINAHTWSSFPRPELKIDIDMLKLPDSQKYVFRIQTSVHRIVTLPGQPKTLIGADVWKVEPVMQAISLQDMPAKVTEVVLKQTEAFIHAYLAANTKAGQPADANSVTAVPKQRVKPAAKQEIAEYKFVASKDSKVFHRPDCHWVKQIKPENLIGYNTRDEAIKAGKRPCKLCKP